jgi:hypothetical protein
MESSEPPDHRLNSCEKLGLEIMIGLVGGRAMKFWGVNWEWGLL